MSGAVGESLEEAMRLAEVGEYLLDARSYAYGDGRTQPFEFGIEWEWQQSTPDQTHGQGVLLAQAVAWHEELRAEGVETEAYRLRRLLGLLPPALALTPDPLGEEK